MQLVINIENMYMNDRSRELPLLEYLSWKAGCEYLSDLHGISSVQKIRLAREIERLPACSISLQEWNDALEYLLGQPPQPDAEAARDALMAGLKAQDEQGEGNHGKLQLRKKYHGAVGCWM